MILEQLRADGVIDIEHTFIAFMSDVSKSIS